MTTSSKSLLAQTPEPPYYTVIFTSTSTDADGDALSCSWTFNSGSPGNATDCEVSGVTFPNAAPYDVTLSVDDGNGGQASATMAIAPCN